jgi:hypothetical protein
METKEEKNKVDSRLAEIFSGASRHWLRYTALSVTGCLTGYAAWSYTGNWLYVIALVLLAEGASLYWASRIEDFGNTVQMIASVVGSVVAWVSIAVTDLASVTIIVKNASLEIFTVFANVPEWAQRTVVYVVPTLAVVQGVLATLHYFFSEEAALRREIAKTNREAEKAIKQADANAQKDMAKARAARYAEIAKEKAPELGRQQGEKSWQDLETTILAGRNGQRAGDPIQPPSSK